MAVDPAFYANRAIPGIPVANLLCCSVALVVVLLRLFARVWIKRAAGWDDGLIVVAMMRLRNFFVEYIISANILLDRSLE